jgi:hypothetical protein
MRALEGPIRWHRWHAVSKWLALCAALVLTPSPWSATPARAEQHLVGEYTAEISGHDYRTTAEPRQRLVEGITSLVVGSDHDRLIFEIGALDSDLSATRLVGIAGHGLFSAIAWDAAYEDQATLFWGYYGAGVLKGTLLIPRIAEGLEPGWLELTVVAQRSGGEAVPQAGSSKPSSVDAVRRPEIGLRARTPGLRRSPSTDLRGPGTPLPSGQPVAFEIETLASLEPAAPTSGQQVVFLLRAEPPRGIGLRSVELYVNARKVAESSGATIEYRGGPYPAGSVAYYLVALDGTGRRATGEIRHLAIREPGRATIRGRIEGRRELIVDVQLVDQNEATLQRTELDASGAYRFTGVPAGRYWVFVNDGKREANIRPVTGSNPIDSDGASEYRMDFRVE